jgi:hypothetical protein
MTVSEKYDPWISSYEFLENTDITHALWNFLKLSISCLMHARSKLMQTYKHLMA